MPNWSMATLAELYTVAYHDDDATPVDRQMAADELLRRIRHNRKPYRTNQHKIRRAFPKW